MFTYTENVTESEKRIFIIQNTPTHTNAFPKKEKRSEHFKQLKQLKNKHIVYQSYIIHILYILDILCILYVLYILYIIDHRSQITDAFCKPVSVKRCKKKPLGYSPISTWGKPIGGGREGVWAGRRANTLPQNDHQQNTQIYKIYNIYIKYIRIQNI